MEDCNYLELQSMAREYKQRRISLQQNKKIATTTPIAMSGYWSQHLSSSGRFYYYNRKTEVSQWHQPHDWHPLSPESYKEKIQLQLEAPNVELAINNVTNDVESEMLHFNNTRKVLNNIESDKEAHLINAENDFSKYNCDDRKKLKLQRTHGRSESNLSPQQYKKAPDKLDLSEYPKPNLNNSNLNCVHNRNFNEDYACNKCERMEVKLRPTDRAANELDVRLDKQHLELSQHASLSDTYAVVINLFTNISTSFKVIVGLEEGAHFEKESSYMLELLMRLTDLVPTLNQSQYKAIFKEYLNLVEEAVQVIMEKMLPAECLEDHEDQLQSLLTRLITVVNENKYNDDDDDVIADPAPVDDVICNMGTADDDDDDDGEIVSDDDNDNCENNCVDTNGRIDRRDLNTFVDADMRINRTNDDVLEINVDFNSSCDHRVPLNGDNSYLDYSSDVYVCNKRRRIDSKNISFGNARDILDPAYYKNYTDEDREHLAYLPPISVSLEFNKSTNREVDDDDDEGLCDAVADDDADDHNELNASFNDKNNATSSEKPIVDANEPIQVDNINSSQPQVLGHNPFSILTELQHLYDARLTVHINSWQTFEKQADQCAREGNSFMNIRYRPAISALKKARSDLRVEDLIYQLQLHRKQHLENQMRNIVSKTL